MPKIVVQDNVGIQFAPIDFVKIIDHREYEGSIFFKYRFNFQVISTNAIGKALTLFVSDVSPIPDKPNMFKGVNIRTQRQSIDAIRNFEVKKTLTLETRFSYIAKISLGYQDLERGFVEFEMNIKSLGNLKLYSFFQDTSTSRSAVFGLRNFDNGPLVTSYELPSLDYFMSTQEVGSDFRRILIGSNDKRIKKFAISEREVNNSSQGQLQKIIGQYEANVINGQAKIDLIASKLSTRNYKVSPISFINEVRMAQCKELSVGQKFSKTAACLLFPTSVTSTRISIGVRSIPVGVMKIVLVKRNLTQKEKYFSDIESRVLGTTSAGLFEDTQIAPYNVYEYKVRHEYSDGSKFLSTTSLVLEPVILNEIMSLNVAQNDKVTQNGLTTATYTATVNYQTPSSTSRVLNDLKTLGIDNVFPNEIKNLSTEIDPLVGILVTRMSLMSGLEERIGIFKQGEITLVSSDTYDIVYKFELCFRSPADILEEIGSSSDFASLAGAQNARSPLIASKILALGTIKGTSNFTQKFFNRFALNQGQLVYGKTLPTSQTGIESGRTGIIKSFLISNSRVTPVLQPGRIIQRDEDIIVSWTATNLADTIGFNVENQEGNSVNCDAIPGLSTYYASIQKAPGSVKINAYTNFGSIITTEVIR